MTNLAETSLNPMAVDDLQRLVEVAQLITAGRDAMSDEIVTRLSHTVSEGLTLLDRLTRNGGLMRLLQVLDRQENQDLLFAVAEAIGAVGKEAPTTPPSAGGLVPLLRLARKPGTHDGLRLLSLIGYHFQRALREQQRQGVKV